MNRLCNAMLVTTIVMLGSLTASATDKEEPTASAEQTRKLIYCADLMTHEEREAYRTRMRAAAGPQQRAELRQAHREEMRTRASEQDLDPAACEPARIRLRLRLRGGHDENAD